MLQNRIEGRRVRSALSGAAPLAHLKQIPVGILKPRGVAPRELEHLRRLKLHAPRCKRFERGPAIVHLDSVYRGTEIGLGRLAWPQNQFEILSRNADGGDPVPSVTASLLVALSDGLLESAYLDDADSVPALVREAVARLLDRR